MIETDAPLSEIAKVSPPKMNGKHYLLAKRVENAQVLLWVSRLASRLAEKAQVVLEITDTLQRVLNKRPELTHVVIEEVDTDNWGYAGMTTTEYRSKNDG